DGARDRVLDAALDAVERAAEDVADPGRGPAAHRAGGGDAREAEPVSGADELRQRQRLARGNRAGEEARAQPVARRGRGGARIGGARQAGIGAVAVRIVVGIDAEDAMRRAGDAMLEALAVVVEEGGAGAQDRLLAARRVLG